MRDLLITTGFSRSGNTYLNYCFKALYYPEEPVRQNNHTVISMTAYPHIFVPFRNPLDCISSWHWYPSAHDLEDDIKFYIRMHTKALELKTRLSFMDFNKFTTDLTYITSRVSQSLGLEPIAEATDEDIKFQMLFEEKHINLPVNNASQLNAIKDRLKDMPSFKPCEELYLQVKEAEEAQAIG